MMNMPLTRQNTPSWEWPDITDQALEQRASDADDSLDDLNVLAEVITDWANFDAVATLIRSISRAAALNNVESVMVLAKSLGYEVEQGALKRIAA